MEWYPQEFFLKVAERLLSDWTPLRLAVARGRGSKDQAIEFCSYVTEMMFIKETFDADDIAVELEDYMDTNFSTQLEDDSATYVANELLRFYIYCINDDETLAVKEFENLPFSPWMMTREWIGTRNSNANPTKDDSSSNREDEDDKQMETVDDE